MSEFEFKPIHIFLVTISSIENTKKSSDIVSLQNPKQQFPIWNKTTPRSIRTLGNKATIPSTKEKHVELIIY